MTELFQPMQPSLFPSPRERAHGVTYTVFFPESWAEAVRQGVVL